MDHVTQWRVASVLAVAVGVWLLVSPLFIAMTGTILINTLVVGGIITLAGLAQLIWENTIPSWVSGIAAVWLMVSAVVFSVSGAALWSQLIAAAAAFLLAAWDGFEVDQVSQQHVHAH